MQKMLIAAAILFTVLASNAASLAEDGALRVGDAAPALASGKWVKGEPVEKLEKGKVYVVEFWATWCGPCRQTIPHLSEMQGKYKDVIFIGQNCWEEDQSAVAPFVNQMGDKMNYRVALDDTHHEKTGAMAKTWMAAAGQNGIPTAFVIDKQARVAWIGHPMEMEEVLKGVIAGTFDARKLAAQREEQEKIGGAINAAMQKQEYDKAIAGIDQLIKLHPDQANQFGGAKFQILLIKQDYVGASALGNQLAEAFKDEPAALNNLAWLIVDPSGGVKKPDVALAEKLAARASEITKNQNAQFLDTLARVYFVKGDIDKAIEIENRAMEKATAPEKVAMGKDLAKYKAAKAKTGR
jgi:thiol-disulfide isomerase/thioredoxin